MGYQSVVFRTSFELHLEIKNPTNLLLYHFLLTFFSSIQYNSLFFGRSIAKNTLDFFGLYNEEDIQHQKWKERRMRHCSKRYGKMKDDLIDFDTEIEIDGPSRRSIVSTGPTGKVRLKSKRESVPSMVYNGLKRRLSAKVG